MSKDPVSNAISKYAQHPSILLIREHTASHDTCDFKLIDPLTLLNETNALNTGEKSS